jgi:hypothetical protein
MTRVAHCCCGSLRAEATGEPVDCGRVSLHGVPTPYWLARYSIRVTAWA